MMIIIMSLVLICPHCHNPIEIEQINCGIFRHAILKINYQQIDPHTPEHICHQLIDYNLIYGCGKPFQIVNQNGEYKAIICGYI
jgi:hypothetical protein